MVACQDGEQGLRLALSQPFALIILDIRLPGLNGLQLWQLLRRKRQTPVIIVSACGAESDRVTGFQHGADDYLAKPFNTADLQLRMETVLRRSQWRQQSEFCRHCAGTDTGRAQTARVVRAIARPNSQQKTAVSAAAQSPLY